MGYKNRNKEKKPGGRCGNRHHQHHGVRAIPGTVSSGATVRPLEINEETRWKPRSLIAYAHERESRELHDARLLRLLLNKLTPQNFDKVVTDFVAQTTIHSSQAGTRDAIKAIMDRASFDMRYAQVYARLCKTLAAVDQNTSDRGQEESCFRQVLVDSCRYDLSPPAEVATSTFDRIRVDDIFEHPEDRKARLALARRRHVGSKRFVGELYNTGVLDTTQALSFVETLRHQAKTFASSECEEPSCELALESLCLVLETCGKALDEARRDSTEMQRCFMTLEEMVCEHAGRNDGCAKLTFRMKCMILDLLELKEAGWNPVRYSSRRRKEMVAKPLAHERGRDEGKSRRKSKRGSRKKGKTVRFSSSSAP